MKGNKILYAGIAILILGIGFAVGTYAYYQTTVSGTISGTVLAWQCNVNNQGQETPFVLNMGSLYPGSSGHKTLNISTTISADYTITFGQFHNMGASSNHPNLNLYRDSGHASVLNQSATISGEVNPGTPVAVNIYYYWPYGTASEAYVSTAPYVVLTVTCTQK